MDDPPSVQPAPGPEEEPVAPPPDAGWRKGLAWVSRIAMILGGGTLAVTGVLWIGMLAGWVPEFPYLTIALGAAAVSLAVLVALHGGGDSSVGFFPRAVRGLAITCAALTILFILWEREDGLALGVELVATMGEVRSEELAWQLAADRNAPKVGDAAPDFELQDPEGVARVRLSDFRGKRPVALVFGSYT